MAGTGVGERRGPLPVGRAGGRLTGPPRRGPPCGEPFTWSWCWQPSDPCWPPAPPPPPPTKPGRSMSGSSTTGPRPGSPRPYPATSWGRRDGGSPWPSPRTPGSRAEVAGVEAATPSPGPPGPGEARSSRPRARCCSRWAAAITCARLR